MAFPVMCAEKMLMLLRLFFITVCAWFYDWQRSGSLLEALRSIWQLDMTDSLVRGRSVRESGIPVAR